MMDSMLLTFSISRKSSLNQAIVSSRCSELCVPPSSSSRSWMRHSVWLAMSEWRAVTKCCKGYLRIATPGLPVGSCPSLALDRGWIGRRKGFCNRPTLQLQSNMEDGEGRLLFLLEPKKQEILRLLPDKTLKEYLECMEESIRGLKFPRSLCRCCLTNKYRRVDPHFQTAFDALPLADKIDYYRKYLIAARGIAKNKARLPDSSPFLEDLPLSRDPVPTTVLYRKPSSKKWKQLIVTLDAANKVLESPNSRIDLRQTFFLRRTNQTEGSYIQLLSWIDQRKDLQLKSQQSKNDDLFQRLEQVADQAMEENIIRILQGESLARISQTVEEATSSHRSLSLRLGNNSSRISIKYNIKEVDPHNCLQYKHPVEPLHKADRISRLIPQGRLHYFLQDDFEITSEGELIATNKKKLDAQTSAIKYIVKRLFSGGKILSISLPVTVFNEDSNLSLLINSYAHAPLQLQSASKQATPLGRFLRVVRFALTCPPSYIRCDKPFNPILGQTYQAMVDGTLFYGQQVSHHPPISAVFIKGRGYTAYGSFEAEVKFGANSAAGNNTGWFKISFDPTNPSREVVRFNNIAGEMGGLLIGKRTLNLKGSVHFVDEQNMILLHLTFGQINLQKTKEYYDSVQGMVVKLKPNTPLDKLENITRNDVEKELGMVTGRWLSQVYFNKDLLINTRVEHPPEIERYSALLPSDYSLREDIILKRKGVDDEICQTAKQSLEEIQRGDRKLRQKFNPT